MGELAWDFGDDTVESRSAAGLDAARAAAVMEALRKSSTHTSFEIFTLVPKWFFDNNIYGEITTNLKSVVSMAC